MARRNYTLIDLFAGCGGLSLGLEQTGFNIVFFNEIMPVYASTYLRNRHIPEGHYFIGDINALNEHLDNYRHIWELEDDGVDLVCGGPPCQGFSMANRQRVIDDSRNNLYKAFLTFLRSVRPKFFIMENVKGMAQRIAEIKDNFREYMGNEYSFDYRILKARNFMDKILNKSGLPEREDK